jgi:hypothetical protein
MIYLSITTYSGHWKILMRRFEPQTFDSETCVKQLSWASSLFLWYSNNDTNKICNSPFVKMFGWWIGTCILKLKWGLVRLHMYQNIAQGLVKTLRVNYLLFLFGIILWYDLSCWYQFYKASTFYIMLPHMSYVKLSNIFGTM